MKEMELNLQAPKDHAGLRMSLSWPWKRKEVFKLLEIIEKQKSSMILAMEGDTMITMLNIDTIVKDIQSHVHTQKEKDVLKWLTRVDPFTNHAAARAKHEPGTGEWFLSSHEFTTWILPGRSLWLHGIPGASKTVLCSMIIESIKARRSSYPLFFYFDFSDLQKQSVVNMLYSFLAQLSTGEIPLEIQQLYEFCFHGTRDATVTQLAGTFFSITKRLASHSRYTYLLIDALDECADRKSLMGVLKEICPHESVNILMASRHEHTISSTLTGVVNGEIPIQNCTVDVDIRAHIHKCLATDPDLSRWNNDLKSLIVDRLTSKSNGMYDHS
jgi:hypothetical protein